MTARRRLSMLIAQTPSERSGYATRALVVATALAGCSDLHVVVVEPNGEPGTDSSPGLMPLPLGRAATLHRSGPGKAAALLAALGADAIVAGETALAPLALAAAGRSAVIVATQNVESALWAERAQHLVGDARRAATSRSRASATIERTVLPRADAVWAVSDDDAVAIRAGFALPGPAVDVVPNAVVEMGPVRSRRPEPGLAVLFGSLWWPPNDEAVRELSRLSERLDRIGRPHAFVVAGHGASDDLRAHMARTPRIQLVGYVDDLGALLDRATCAVMPIVSGGGTMVKLVDALRHECPVLTTPAGARGLSGLVSGEHALVEPIGPGFDDACAWLLDAPGDGARMASRGRQLVADRYCLAAVDSVVDRLVDRVCDRDPRA